MSLVHRALRRLGLGSYLPRNVFEVADLDCLMRALHWRHLPVLVGDDVEAFANMPDINRRRLRDAGDRRRLPKLRWPHPARDRYRRRADDRADGGQCSRRAGAHGEHAT